MIHFCLRIYYNQYSFLIVTPYLHVIFMITSWSSLPPLIFNMNEKKQLDWVLIKATDRKFLRSIILFQFSRMPLTLIGVLHHIEKYKHEDEQPDEERGR